MGVDELGGMSYYVGILLGLMFILQWGLKNVNSWIFERDLGKKKRECLPPGDLGWPFVGNMWSFLRAFKSGGDPEAFISTFFHRFGSRGIYKSYMFGSPSIIVTVPEACWKILLDDNAFKPGWPATIQKLIGRKSFGGLSYEDHKRLRKLTAAPINGHEALSTYMPYIETNVVSALEKWSKTGQIEFLTEIRKLTFKIIMNIFLSSESEQVMEALEKDFASLNYGVRAMAINIPGFAYYNALKARKRLVAIFQTIVYMRRKKREATNGMPKKDMLDALLDVVDEKGGKLDNEEIIDLLVMYLNAGHESSAHITLWSTILLQANPEFFRIAKEEQEMIAKNMSPMQEGLTLKEYRQMKYLSKVIDETLRFVTIALMTFREAKRDVDLNGYIVPKGWKVLIWFRSLHHNPDLYSQPKLFNPSRWDDHVPKPGTFLPFGVGSSSCPGSDLAKIEIAFFLHHFLLNYEFERENPECPVMYLPHVRPTDNCLGKIRRVSK